MLLSSARSYTISEDLNPRVPLQRTFTSHQQLSWAVMAVPAVVAAVVVVDLVHRVLTQGKITTKIPEQGHPIWNNSPCCLYIEVSDDLSCGIILFNVAG
jgi:hypothetical protein